MISEYIAELYGKSDWEIAAWTQTLPTPISNFFLEERKLGLSVGPGLGRYTK